MKRIRDCIRRQQTAKPTHPPWLKKTSYNGLTLATPTLIGTAGFSAKALSPRPRRYQVNFQLLKPAGRTERPPPTKNADGHQKENPLIYIYSIYFFFFNCHLEKKERNS
jgi:hypothetical protein